MAFALELALLPSLGETIVEVLGLLLGASLIQLVARDLGGVGTYDELVYAIATYSAPLTLIANVLAPIPTCVHLTIPLGLYGLVLQLKAIRTVHGFDWVSAIASLALISLPAGSKLCRPFTITLMVCGIRAQHQATWSERFASNRVRIAGWHPPELP